MSNSSESGGKAGSLHDSDTSSAFKALWRKSTKRSPREQNFRFVQQDPGIRMKSRISRILKGSSTPSSQEDGDESQTPSQKRRKQVYQAQKRHRDKQAQYVHDLEKEIARLQHLDSMVNSERNALALQNNAIKEFLAKQSIDTYLDSINLNSSYPPTDELSPFGGATVDIRFDEELGQERIFLDFPDTSDTSEMLWTSSEAPTDESLPTKLARHAPVQGDSWAALDFILALEWPCRAHVKHEELNPTVEVSEACKLGNFHGHALTASKAVYSSALRDSSQHKEKSSKGDKHVQSGLQPDTSDNWVLPHSEIDKLVELAELLDLDPEYMTPAQAYSAIRETVPSEKFLRPTLQALKKPLGSLMQCYGFGACMDTHMFWQHLDATIEDLKVNRPDLGR